MAEMQEDGDELRRRLSVIEDELRRLSMAPAAGDPWRLARREQLDAEQAEIRGTLGLPAIRAKMPAVGLQGWLILVGACVLVVTVLAVVNL